jgi:glycosyltransferase involved in cell wall biosynthesis
MRIAYFSPLSPQQTAIADYSEGLLPYLAEHAQVDVFVDDGVQPTDPFVRERLRAFNYREYPTRRPYDATIYNMGDNTDFHAYLYRILLEHSGIVILHDVVLHHFFLGLTVHKKDVAGYLAEMRYAYGPAGETVARQVLAGRGGEFYCDYPLVERVLDASTGVIVHNGYARSEVLRRRPDVPVACIPQPFFLPAGFPADFDSSRVRAEMGLSDRFVVASFGFFIPDKRLNVALCAFARLLETCPNAVYLLVGGHSPYYDLPGHLQAMGLGDRVILTGWQAPVPFVQHMFATDLAIHLRYPHLGGTPYTPIRLMGLGVPTISSDIEPLAEIPADACARIEVDELEEYVLAGVLSFLADHPEVRRQMADSGRRYVREHHDPRRIATAIIDFIGHVRDRPVYTAARPAGYDVDLLREVAATLAGWGVTEADDAWLRPVAEALAGLGLARNDGREWL